MNPDSEAALVRALRAYPGAPAPEALHDDPRFWERALRGGVAVLLASSMDRWTPERSQLARAQAAMGLRTKAVLSEALRLCARAGIPALPLKGPLLGARLYPEAHLRPTSDVDLLVPAADRDAVLEVLVQAGAQLQRQAELDYYGEHHHHVNVALHGILIEVHFRASTNFGVELASEPLLARSRPATVSGVHTRLLEPHDELGYLALHAAAHNLVRDVLLLDLARFAAQQPMDAAVLHERARSWNLERAIGAALAAAVERCGFPERLVEPAWLARSRRLLARLPHDLPAGDSEDRGEQLRGFYAQAWLSPDPQTALRSLAQAAVRIGKRRAQKRWPGLVPEAWSG